MMGFAAGAMTAASAFGLIIPAMEQSACLGRWAFFPAFAGAWGGILLLLIFDGVLGKLLCRGVKAAVIFVLLFSGLPVLWGASAGAMLYVVVKDLIPAQSGADRGSVFFGLGFTVMMVLCRLGQ